MTDVSPDLTSEAVRRISRLLLDGTLAPGAAVSRRRIAEMLDMGYQPVNMALKILENEGIIQSRNRSGTQVASLRLCDYWSVIQERLAIEQKAVQLICRHIDDEQVAALLPLAREADRIVPEPEALEHDDRFHRSLIECVGAEIFSASVHSLVIFRIKSQLCPSFIELNKIFQTPLSTPPGGICPRSGHQYLLKLILRHDEPAALEYLDRHICDRRLYGLIFPARKKCFLELPAEFAAIPDIEPLPPLDS